MLENRKTVRIVGILFLLQMITAVLSYSVILDPILHSKDFLLNVYTSAIQVKLAMLSDLICGASIVSIAVLLYPILKRHSERIALWYVGLRVIEFTTIVFNGICLLSLVSLSKKFAATEGLELTYLEVLGTSILNSRGWTQNMTIIVYCLGASTFYYLLFKTKLIPRFISLWGLLAVVLLFTEMMLITFGDSLRMILMIPMGLNEIFLGIWLIVKGFNSEAMKPNIAKETVRSY